MIRTVSIYCASSEQIDTVYIQAAERLGSLLGQQGLRVVNGAGNTGLMRTVADAVMSAGGTVTGVIPRFMVDNGWFHPHLTEMRIVETMHERKQMMADLSDAAIALPGGCGTLEELLEIITWRQLELYSRPIVILNTNHYYDPLLAMLRRAADEHFMPCEWLSHWRVAQTPDEIPALLTS